MQARRRSCGPGSDRSLLVAGVFSFFLHLCGGLRHLFWDSGHGFELRSDLPLRLAGGRGELSAHRRRLFVAAVVAR